MTESKNIGNLSFEEFDSVDLPSWKKKIEADLKGKTWSDFLWEIEPGLELDPAQFQWENEFDPLFNRKEQFWIGQQMTIGQDLQKANTQLLDMLMQGVSAPQFHIDRILTRNQWAELFNQVELQYLQPTFHFSEVDSAYQNLANLSQLSQVDKTFKGIIKCKSGSSKALQNLRRKISTTFPLLKTITIQINQGVNTNEIAKAINEWLELKSNFTSDSEWLNASNLEIKIGDDFLKEIGKLRAIHAIKNLISDELKIINAEDTFITVSFEESSLNEEAELAIIQLTSRSLAANLGGANQVVLPILEKEKAKFNQRITSNIQHIISLESNMDRVGDPLAGSHFVEAVTEKIAEVVWKKMKG